MLQRIKENIRIVEESDFEWYFDLREFCITDAPVPQIVADKIIKYHMLPMNLVREEFGMPIIVSRRSGYRPMEYERSKGRAGTSQHNFKGLGAADYTHSGDEYDWNEFIRLIIILTDYTRVCWYPNNNFVHCDYSSGERQLFTADSPAGAWEYKGRLEDFKTIKEL